MHRTIIFLSLFLACASSAAMEGNKAGRNVNTNRPPAANADDEGEDDLFDEDEVESLPPKLANQNGARKGKVSFGPVDKQNYVAELFALAFIAVYIANFFAGRRRNEQIARKWADHFVPYLRTQFSEMGVHLADSQDVLLKESQSCFRLYASGRRYCHGMLATLELKKRHDLISLLLAIFDLSATQDILTVEIPLRDDDVEAFVVAVVKKRLEKRFRRNNKQVDQYVGGVKSKQLTDSFQIICELPELETLLVDNKVVQALAADDRVGSLQSLSVSDQTSLHFGPDVPRKVLRAVFQLGCIHDPKFTAVRKDQNSNSKSAGGGGGGGGGGDVDLQANVHLLNMFKLVINFLDQSAQVHLSSAGQKKVEMARKVTQELQKRQAQAQLRSQPPEPKRKSKEAESSKKRR